MIAFPFARPFYMMAKPVGAACNLACHYCYYLEKQELYEGAGRRVMSDETLELFVQQYLESQTNPAVLFTWHGGEPLLLPVSFYEKAMTLQRRYADGRHVDNCLQTNGTLLTDEWCRFFRDNGWLIGVSIDGPQPLHDAYRKTSTGASSWEEVMHGIELLEKHGVMWNALATVNAITVKHPVEVYRFFRDIGCRYLQFTPVGSHSLTTPDEGHVEADDWGRFLCGVYDEWEKNDVGEVFVNIFEAILANYMGITPGICSMSDLCGHVGVVEWNGDVYSCDHFVTREHRLGNIREKTIYEMMHSEQQQTFARQKTVGLPEKCKACKWLFACHGECPRNHQSLCEGYRMFFERKAVLIRGIRA